MLGLPPAVLRQALTQFSLFALGIMPYITSSIIMQILTVVIPKLQEWQQQGAVGQKKITQWTRYLTVGISVLQSTGLVFLFHNGGGGLVRSAAPDLDLVPNFRPPACMLIVATFTAGSALMMWMGELITNRGIGNGMSLIIFCLGGVEPAQRILRRLARHGNVEARHLPRLLRRHARGLIVFIELGQRRIPVQFAKRVVGRRMYAGQSTYIPLKVNQAGVVPIIFASRRDQPAGAAVAGPARGRLGCAACRSWINDNLANTINPVYLVFSGCSSSASPTSTRPSPSIPSSRRTTSASRAASSRASVRAPRPSATWEGAQPHHAAGSALHRRPRDRPDRAGPVPARSGASGAASPFGGTSLLIAVGVALETMKQVDSQLMMRNYEGFLKSK